MDDHEEYEILCTGTGYILRAHSAPPPRVEPFSVTNDGGDLPSIYYISIGAFYMALCDGHQLFMTANIDSSIRLYTKVGARFIAISKSAACRTQKLTLNDLYITYDQCTTVMLQFFVQITNLMDPSIDIEKALLRLKRNDDCIITTIHWIQNLEVAIQLMTSRLSVHDIVRERDRVRHMFAKGYGAAAFPYAYLLSKEYLLHTTLRNYSTHPLGAKRLLPMLSVVVEGYIVYNSSRTTSFDCYRSISAQNALLFKLNLSKIQKAEENANKLLSEEEIESERARRKAEKKRAKRLRHKHNKKASSASNVVDAIIDSTEEEIEADAISEKDSVDIMMDEFPEFSSMYRKLRMTSLSPYANPFVPH